MSDYNYKFKKWKEDDAAKLVERAKKLKPENTNSFIAKDVVVPKDKEANDAYSGTIMLWKNKNTYTVGFFFGYYCGDMFFERTTDVKFDKFEKLQQIIENIQKQYCTEEMINEIIEDEIKCL